MEKATDSSKSSPKQEAQGYGRKEVNFPKVPKRDETQENKARKTPVATNLRQISFGTNLNGTQICQFALIFNPAIAEDNYPLKKKVVKTMKDDLDQNFEKYFQAGDTLFGILNQNNFGNERVYNVKIDEGDYKVTLKKTNNSIDCRNINKKTKDFIKVKNFVESLTKNILSANNHIIRFDDRAFYDYKNADRFGKNQSSQIWHGYSTAVCITDSGLYLRINDKNKMITGKTAYDKMLEIANKYGGNMKDSKCHTEILEYFKGKTVVALYGNFRAYRIGDVSTDSTVNNTTINCKDHEGNEHTVDLFTYYSKQYNIKIKNRNQPLLIEEPPKKPEKKYNTVQLVPELVYLSGIDELEEKERAEIIEKSKFDPSQKFRKFEEGMRYLNNKEKKKILKNGRTIEKLSPNEIRELWGINYSNSFTNVEARFLDIPRLQFGNNNTFAPQIKNGRFAQKEDKAPVNFNNHNCICLTFRNLTNQASSIFKGLSQAGGAFKISFSEPAKGLLTSNDRNQLINDLKKADFNNGKEIAMVILDRNTKTLYPFIKNYLYTEAGITSQFLLMDGGKQKGKLSYYSAVLNQMVVKGRGELFALDFPNNFVNAPAMIIGIDSSKTSQGTKYVISGSYNRKINKFYTDIKIAKTLDEKGTILTQLIRSVIDNFKKQNKDKTPSNIIIYRQGGNEKQTEKMMNDELPAIEEFLSGQGKCYAQDYKPRLTVFSVNKRTDLKFFEKKQDRYANIPMGTVIDKNVVSPDCFEFYLQCPEVNRGTASPVHFLCVYNNNDLLTLDEFEEIAYRQSYYYWNWPGPVRIPAALKYAEVANTFTTKNNIGEVLEKLKDTPYFI